MRELVLDFKRGQASTLSRDLTNAIEKVEAYVDERSSDRVRDWMLNVIEETTASVRDGRDQLGDDSEPEDEGEYDRSDGDSDSSPPAPKRKLPASSRTASSRSTPTSVPVTQRPVRQAAKKASVALKEDALSSEKPGKELRTTKSLPRIRSASRVSAPCTVSVTLPSSPLLPPPSLGSATRSRTRRLSETTRLVGSQAIVGHGVPSTALQRTSSIRDTTVRNSSGSSFDSTVPGTPDVDDDIAEPFDDFHLPSAPVDHIESAHYGPSAGSHYSGEHAYDRSMRLPAPYRPQYDTPVPTALLPPSLSHADSHGGHPYDAHPDAYPHPYPHPYAYPYPASYPAEYAYAPAEPDPNATRPAHPRQYSWANEQPSSERQAKRPTKRRALSQQLPPPPMHEQYYAPPHAYGYHPMHHPQHPHHAQYVKQEPHSDQQPNAALSHYAAPPTPIAHAPYQVLPPLPSAPGGPEADRLAALRARKERMAAEQEEIRLEEERLGLASH